MSHRGQLNLDAALTIQQLVMYFDGDVTYDAIAKWVRRDLLEPAGRDGRGRLLIRLRDALQVEASTHLESRGRPRQNPCLLSTSDLS